MGFNNSQGALILFGKQDKSHHFCFRDGKTATQRNHVITRA
jgi:hypothetical protein